MSAGDWIEHDGSGLPADVRGKRCECVFEMEPGRFETATGIAGSTGGYSWDWRWWGLIAPDGGLVPRIVRYRLLRDEPLAALREIAANPPAKILEDA